MILSEKGDSSLTSASPSAEDPETFSSSEQWLVYQVQGTMHRTKGHPSVCKIIFNMTSILFKFLNKNAEVSLKKNFLNVPYEMCSLTKFGKK